MDHRDLPTLNTQILEEASTWFVELNEGDLSAVAREAFAAWLRASPEHVRAFLQISALWEDVPRLSKSGSADIDALLARPRSENNVVPLGVPTAPQGATDSPGRGHQAARRWPMRLALAAGILTAAVGAGLWADWHQGVYATGIGETRWVALADGSTVELNAESRIRVRFKRTERDVDLLHGQALFQVSRNPARPFVVHSGPARITDVGTEFDVYRRPADTIVTVLEGKVAVSSGSDPNPVTSPPLPNRPRLSSVPLSAHADANVIAVMITTGEQADLTPQGSSRPIHADVAAATAWTRQKLVFASAPLSEVVTQYNLYHEKRLVIRDPSLESYHVSGEFSATDSAALVAFLRAQPTLVIRDTDNEIDVSRR
ncbi:MAG: FecR family protein [Chloroflexota bacterium]